MKKPIMPIAVASFLLSLAACHLSPQATNAAAERLFVMALNAVFRVASSDLLPEPPVKPRPRCELTREAPTERKASEVCSRMRSEPILVKGRKASPVVAF